MVLVGSTSRFLRNPGNLKVNLALPFSLLHGDGRGGGAMSDSGDDTRALVSLEQNIANLEKSIRFNQNSSSATPGANGRNVRFNRYGHSLP